MWVLLESWVNREVEAVGSAGGIGEGDLGGDIILIGGGASICSGVFSIHLLQEFGSDDSFRLFWLVGSEFVVKYGVVLQH